MKNISRLLTRLSQITLSAVLLSITSTSFADNRDADNLWHVSVSPYLWAIDMNGEVEIAGVREKINQTFDDTLKKFEGGGMLRLDVSKNKFGFFTDVMFVVLSENLTSEPIPVSTRNKLGIASAGASYQIFRKNFSDPASQLTLDPYLGARFTLNDASIHVAGLRLSNNVRWVDPIIGARLTYDYNQNWQAILSGDIGGTSTSRDESYDVFALLGYKINFCRNTTTLYLGYQLLYQKYITGNDYNQFEWNMRLFGPMVGVSIDLF